MYAAIPTLYRGRQYRSRLEARWAAMFDLLGWAYEYEPYDLNGWIPDFVLMGKRNVLVEVKPILGDFDSEPRELDEVATKIRRALNVQWHPLPEMERGRASCECWPSSLQCQEAIVLGASPFIEHKHRIGAGTYAPTYAFGFGWWARECAFSSCMGGGNSVAVLIGHPREDPGVDTKKWDFCSMEGDWGGRLFGGHKCWQGTDVLPGMWAEAGNIVQWKRPRMSAEDAEQKLRESIERTYGK